MDAQTVAAHTEALAAKAAYLAMRAEYLAAVARGHGGVVLEAEVARVLGLAGERWADALSAYDSALAADSEELAWLGADGSVFVA